MNKSLVQQQFGTHAASYLDSAPHAKGDSLARLVAVAAPQQQWQALDIATGAGHVAAALAPHVAHVIASDLTMQMLAQAAKLAASRGLTNVSTQEADAEQLPFPDARFDLVACRIAPHHFPDVRGFVAEVFRVLRPGGVFALVDNIAPDDQSLPGFSEAQLEESASVYNEFEKLRDPSHVRCLTLGEWLHLIEDAGFTVRHREILAKPMDFADWVGRLGAGADAAVRLEHTLRAGPAALRAMLAPHEKDGRLWFKVDEAVIAAVKPAQA